MNTMPRDNSEFVRRGRAHKAGHLVPTIVKWAKANDIDRGEMLRLATFEGDEWWQARADEAGVKLPSLETRAIVQADLNRATFPIEATEDEDPFAGFPT